MFINTTLLIFFIFLIPSLIFYFYPYKSKTCVDYGDPTTKCFGILIATALLAASIIVTSVRLSSPILSEQKVDLSKLVFFKSNPDTSDIYTTLINK